MPLRVLVISPYPLLPRVHGGRARTTGLAIGLARAGAEVAVLCPWAPSQPRSWTFPGGVSGHAHLLAANALPAVLPESFASPLALLSLQPRSPWGVRRWLRSFSDFDVVQFEFCAQARWMELASPRAKIVYSAHNVELDFLHHAAGSHRLERWSAQRVERLERLAVRRSDLVITCAEEDVRRLAELYGRPSRSAVVPQGCDAALLRSDRARIRNAARAELGLEPHHRVLLFLGGDAWHNREAVRFLVDRVRPKLGSDTRLLIVGKCGRELRGRDDSGVICLGFVDDLAPVFAAADVALNTVSDGSGSSVKLAYYLGAGLPVLSTPAGVRGQHPLSAGVRVTRRERFAEALSDIAPARDADRPPSGGVTWDELGRRLFQEYEALDRPSRMAKPREAPELSRRLAAK
jgi:glycosyltransferase involved in cell wall biosynthesis